MKRSDLPEILGSLVFLSLLSITVLFILSLP
jgi:hypothetical protein